MKKILMAVLGITAAIHSASADVRTGFYMGATAALNSQSGKAKLTDPTVSFFGKYDMGRHRLGGGVFMGYGFLCNCLYFAGELAYNYANNSASCRETNGNFTRLRLTNKHIFNFAGLIGYKLTPSSVGYIRLGGNWSEPKVKSIINGTSVNREKPVLSFVPGLGMETSINRNIRVRLEYTYDFGRKLSRKHHITEKRVSVHRMNTHSAKVGVAWVF